ncbi:MAG: hypothetical protein JO149_01545, partial [Gammaproteobacteria bacterium]|nr:hypothetical protein [Gammaproteobacteria bacterium]
LNECLEKLLHYQKDLIQAHEMIAKLQKELKILQKSDYLSPKTLSLQIKELSNDLKEEEKIAHRLNDSLVNMLLIDPKNDNEVNSSIDEIIKHEQAIMQKKLVLDKLKNTEREANALMQKEINLRSMVHQLEAKVQSIKNNINNSLALISDLVENVKKELAIILDLDIFKAIKSSITGNALTDVILLVKFIHAKDIKIETLELNTIPQNVREKLIKIFKSAQEKEMLTKIDNYEKNIQNLKEAEEKFTTKREDWKECVLSIEAKNPGTFKKETV